MRHTLSITVVLILFLLCNAGDAFYTGTGRGPRAFHRAISKFYAISNIETQSEYETILKATKGLTVVDFQKSNCRPCKRVAPLIEAMAEQYGNSCSFYKVDADSSPDALALMKHVGVRSVPTFYIWKDGKQIDKIQGAHVDELEQLLKLESMQS